MKIALSNRQLDKLADLSLGLGQLLFASTVLPFAITSLDKPPFSVLALGSGLAIALWLFAIWIVKGEKRR